MCMIVEQKLDVGKRLVTILDTPTLKKDEFEATKANFERKRDAGVI